MLKPGNLSWFISWAASTAHGSAASWSSFSTCDKLRPNLSGDRNERLVRDFFTLLFADSSLAGREVCRWASWSMSWLKQRPSLHDIAGNVRPWCSDWSGSGYNHFLICDKIVFLLSTKWLVEMTISMIYPVSIDWGTDNYTIGTWMRWYISCPVGHYSRRSQN